jgi:hypothetical protein
MSSVVFATLEILAEFEPLSPRAVAEFAPPELVGSHLTRTLTGLYDYY